MYELSSFNVLLIFLASSIAIWFAGVTLAKTTNTLDTRFKIGDALGGLILLGIVNSLPELAVIYGAAVNGHYQVITGNIIGGISIQVLILVVFDFLMKGKRPLSYLAGSVLLSLETLFAVVIALLSMAAMFVPAEFAIWHINPFSFLVLFAWVFGLYLINKARKIDSFNEVAADALPGRKHHERRKEVNHHFYAKKSNLTVILIFVFAALVAAISGYFLEESGTIIASDIGIGTGMFAATVMAFVTALPELSTGLESIFIHDNQLAISDIVGGNAFKLVTFLFADLVTGVSVLSYAHHADIVFIALGILMMSVYAISYIFRPKRRYLRLGLDSILEIIIYIAGMIAILNIK